MRDGFVLAPTSRQTWAPVERIRLREEELAAAIADVDGFIAARRGTARASWWLTDRSTPADEDAFLAAGLQVVDELPSPRPR